MEFKTWLSEWVRRVQCDFPIMLNALGISDSKMKLLSQGSHADIYLHPTNPNQLIKVTNDKEDVANLISAQSLHSPNVVKCYDHTTEGVANGTALLVDYIRGGPAPYSTPEFLALIEGQRGDDPRAQANIRIMRPDSYRTAILAKHSRFNKQELLKLSQLFKVIHLLESKLDIMLVDLDQNIIDNGSSYVIVDFGR